MKQKYKPLSGLRLTSLACLLALTMSGVPLAQAGNASKPAPESAADIAKAKKAAARVLAEKQRALREARELEESQASTDSADNAEPVLVARAAAAEGAANTGTLPALRDVLAAATPDLSAQRIASEAGLYIGAAVHRLGLSPKASAGTAGFIVGMGGPWVYSRIMGASSNEATSAFEGLAVEAADASVMYLEQRYSLAEQRGRTARYVMIMLMAGGLIFVGHKTLSRKSARVSRRTSRLGKEPSDMTEKIRGARGGLFAFMRKKETPADPAAAAAEGVLVSYDVEKLHDYAVNLLFARGRHDLSGVGDMLTPNLARSLSNYFKSHEARGHWNKVDRVSAVKCKELETWKEGDTSYARMDVAWKALDYVVNYNKRPDEAGYIVEGSPDRMDTFREEWTVLRKAGEAWRVDIMCPAQT